MYCFSPLSNHNLMFDLKWQRLTAPSSIKAGRGKKTKPSRRVAASNVARSGTGAAAAKSNHTVPSICSLLSFEPTQRSSVLFRHLCPPLFSYRIIPLLPPTQRTDGYSCSTWDGPPATPLLHPLPSSTPYTKNKASITASTTQFSQLPHHIQSHHHHHHHQQHHHHV